MFTLFQHKLKITVAEGGNKGPGVDCHHFIQRTWPWFNWIQSHACLKCRCNWNIAIPPKHSSLNKAIAKLYKTGRKGRQFPEQLPLGRGLSLVGPIYPWLLQKAKHCLTTLATRMPHPLIYIVSYLFNRFISRLLIEALWAAYNNEINIIKYIKCKIQ